jgi:hypothetical protein
MAYTDHPGKGIQNQLYLRVITPAAVMIDGDVTAFPTVSNNVQRVHIDTPAPGVYTIEVHDIDVAHGCCTGDPVQVVWSVRRPPHRRTCAELVPFMRWTNRENSITSMGLYITKSARSSTSW